MNHVSRRLLPLSALFAFLLPITAHAATAQFRVLFDVDHVSSTGCTVGGMAGVDRVLDTAITFSDTTGTVTSVTRRDCVSGVLTEPVAVSPGGWPVGMLGGSGNLVIETAVPVSAFGASYPFNMRVGFSGTLGNATAELLTDPNGTAILWPERQSGSGRRHAAGGGTTPLVHTIELDGQTHDWGAIKPEAVAANNGSSAMRLTKAYAYATADTFFFRFDTMVSANAPVATDDTYTVRQGKTLNVGAPGVLGNDSDPNGGALTATTVTPTVHGNLSLNPNGGFIYINDGVLVPDDTFEYKASNGSAESNVAKVKINVTPNASPKAVADAYNVAHRGTLTIPAPGVLTNDTDADHDPLRAQLTSQPQNGTVSLNLDGSFTYTHNGSNTLQDSFNYRVSDGIGSSTSTTVTLTIAADIAPVAVGDAHTLAEGGTLAVAAPGVLGNDTDADTPAQFLTAVLVTGPANGTFTLNTDGSFNYVHNGSETTTDSFTYRVSDGIANSNTVTVTLSITAINDAPVAVADAYTTSEDTALNVAASGVLANDTDGEGQTLTATVVTGPSKGTLTLNANGSFLYTPNANANGTDTFTYTVSDGTATSAPATVTITVTAVNDAPVNTVAPVTTPEDTTVSLGAPTIADVDAASGSLTVTLTATNGGVTGGGVAAPTLTLNGTVAAINTQLANVQFVPNANYNGPATVTMVTSDNGNTGNGGAQSDTDIINVTVTAVNDTPSFTVPAAAGAVNEDAGPQTVNGFATGISAGPADEAGQTLTFNASIVSADATLTFSAAPSISPAGVLTYTASPNAYGTATISVTLSDNGTPASTSAAQTFTITINAVNDEPTFTIGGNPPASNEDAGAQTVNGFATAISLGANEAGQTGTFTVTSNGGTVFFTADPQIDANGNLTYTAAPNSFGTATFNVVLKDNGSNTAPNDNTSATATFTITVNSVNDAPSVTSSNTVTFVEGAGPIVLNNALTIIDVDSLMLQSAAVVLSGNADGSDVLACPACAGLGLTATFTPGVGLTITATAPISSYQTALRSVTLDNPTDSPALAQRGIDWFVTDNGGLQSANTATNDTTVNITATNDAPVNTMPAAQSATEDVVLTLSGANAIVIGDPDAAGADVKITLNVTNGIATLDATATAALTSLTGNGTSTVVAVGTIAELNDALDGMTFLGNTNYNGPAAIQIVTDDLGNAPSGALTDTDSLTITISAVNDAPSFVVPASAPGVSEDTAGVQTVAGFVTSIAAGPTADETGSQTVSFNVSNNNNSLFSVQPAINAAGDLTYTLAANQSGSTTVSVTASDNGVPVATSGPQTFSITVSAVNDAPVNTVPGAQAVNEDAPLTFNTANLNALSIADVDAGTGSVQVSLSVTNGTLTLGATTGLTITSGTNGSAAVTFTGTVSNVNAALQGLRYDPTADYSGGAVLTIITNDQGNSGSGGALSDTDTVNITVNAVNDAPVLAGAGTVGYTENQAALAIAPAITVSDVDNANLTGATVSISSNFNSAQDVLALPAPVGAITASYNAGTGVLTLTGTDTLANYQLALRSVTYANTSDAPTTATRDINIAVNDGTTSSNVAVAKVNITATNDAAVVTAGATLSYTENQAATAIDTTVTVADVDSLALASATVQITGNYVNGEDVLTFANTANITGSFDATTGKLTLSGSDTVANYQAALRTVKYSNTSENPNTGARTVTWVVNDGVANSSAVTSTINVAAVNDAPTVTPSSNLAYTEGEGAKALDGGVTITDPDSTQISGATVQITGNYANGQDVLAFANTATITGSFNAVTGTLTLTGADTLANYQAALRTVTYTNTSNAPSALTRTVTWNATDASAGTGAGLTSTIAVTSLNTAPTVTAGSTVSYTENAAALVLESALAVTDPDSATLAGATVSLTTGFQTAEDVLSFTTNGTITGSYNATTGVLTLSGSDTVANYQSVLRTVKYANTSDNPSTASRTAVWTISDGTDSSTAASTTINVAATNDAPVVTVAPSASYTEDAAPTVLSSGLTVTDADNANITGATVSLTTNFASAEDVLSATGSGNVTVSYNSGTGVLTLSGTDTVAVYQAVLRTVAYSNSSQNPSALTRSVSWSVNDGTTNGTAASTVAVVNVNDAPAITAGGTLNFTENGGAAAIDNTITISDADSTNLTGATVTIGNFAGAEDVLAFATIGAISGSYNAGTGVLTLTGTATVANYQAALRTVTYRNTSENPSTTARTISWVVNDGTAPSNTATSTVNVSAVNDAPVVAAAGTSSYTEDSAPVVASSTITVSDADSNIASATVAITANFVSAEDVLAFATIGSISGSYNSTTGVLTLTGAGTPAEYQAALRTVTYSNPSQSPTTATRTLTWNVNDGALPSSGTTSTMAVVNVNDAPILTAGATLAYTENDPATAIDTTITVSDVDSANLSGATVTISAGFQAGADVLAVATQNGISGSYNAGTGVLTLSGASSVANYQTALRSVTYRNTSENPTATRTISWVATDGTTPSSAVTSTINLTAVNDAPALTAGATLSYTENQPAAAIDATVTVTDVDSTNLSTATVQITGNYQNGQDILSFATIGSISGTFDASTGTLTLTGTDTVANYQAALRTVKYNNTSENPITTARTVTWTASDGAANSNQPTSTITVTAVNDAPAVTAGATLAYTEQDPAAVIDATVTVADVDSANLTGATITISANFQNGADVLSFATIGAISGSYNAATGVLTLTGTDTVANYQAALRTVKFNNTSDTPTTAARTISFVATDGTNPSSAATSTINVTAVNDAPVNTVPAAQTTPEDTNRVFSSGNGNQISISDPDGDVTVQVTVSATNGTLSTNGITGLSFTIGDGTDDATMTFTGTVSVINARLNGLTFKPNLNYYSGSPTTDLISITTNDQGNTGTGGALQDADSISMDVDPVNDAPIAASYTVANNNPHITASGIGITISAADSNDLKEDATDVDLHDPFSELTVQIVGGTLSPANATLTLIDASTGAFYFEPPGGLSGTGVASFQYKVCDNGDATLGLAALCSDPATVQFTITGTDTWFVDDTDAAGCGVSCNGSRTKPLVGLNNALLAARGTGDRIFAFSGTYTHGFTMAASERLIGQAATSTFDAHFGVAVPSNGTLDSRPTMSGTPVTLQNTLTAANNTLLRGIAITSGANKGYVSASGNTTLTVLESSVNSTGNMAIDVTGATSAATSVAFTSTTSSGGSRGVSLDGVNGTWSLGSGALNNHTQAAFYLQNANASTITYSGNMAPGTGRAVLIGTADGNSAANASNGLEAGSAVTLSGNLTAGGIGVYESSGGTLNLTGTTHTFSTSTVNAVELIDNDGATFNFSGGNLALTTTTGKAFSATQGGTVNVTGANNTISITGGGASTRGLEITGASAARMAGTQSWKTINQSGGDRGISVCFFDGPVTVAGTGAAGTGGIIQSISTRGVEFINVLNGASNAVSLTNMNFVNASTTDLGDTTSPTYTTGTCGTIASGGSNTGCSAALHFDTVNGVTLSGINVSGTTSQIGINGYSLTNLSLTNVDVGSVGDESNEDAINLQDIGGTITFTNLNSHNNRNRNLSIVQKTKTATLTATNSKFNNSTNEQGLIMEAVAATASLTATYTSCEFKNNLSYGLNGTIAIAGGNLTVNVASSTLTGNTAAGGMLLQAGGGNLNYSITNNTINMNNISIAITSSTSGNIGASSSTISGNTLGINGVLDSCSASGSTCINLQSINASTLKANVTGNTLYGVGTYGIRHAASNTAKSDITITGNSVTQFDAGSAAGIVVETGFPAGSTTCTRLTLGGAGALKNTVGTPAAGVSIWLDDTASGTFNLAGYPGGSVATYVESTNTIGAGSGFYNGTFANGTCP